ncbi:hypothetical protein A203_21700 [Chromobacterium violaceum]
MRAVLHAALACAGAEASGQSCGAGAAGGAASVALNNALDKLQHTDADKMTAEEKLQRENLVNGLLTGLSTATGGAETAATTVNAAKTEMENNEFGRDEQLKFQGLVAAQKICPDQKCRDMYAKRIDGLIRGSSVAQVRPSINVVVGEKDHVFFYPEKSKLNPDYVSIGLTVPLLGTVGGAVNLYNFNGYMAMSGGRQYPGSGGFGASIVLGNIIGGGDAGRIDNFLSGAGYSASAFYPVWGLVGAGGGVNHSIGGDTSIEYGLGTPGFSISPASYSEKIRKGK